MKRLCIPLLLAFSLTACLTTPAPIPPPGPATCVAVCANMVKLNCPAARPTAKGATCEQVCSNLQASGIAAWNLGCRSSALTCKTMDACEAVR